MLELSITGLRMALCGGGVDVVRQCGGRSGGWHRPRWLVTLHATEGAARAGLPSSSAAGTCRRRARYADVVGAVAGAGGGAQLLLEVAEPVEARHRVS